MKSFPKKFTRLKQKAIKYFLQTTHLPLLSQDSIKPWLEAVISNIDSNKLASYVEEKVYTQPKYGTAKSSQQWVADKRPKCWIFIGYPLL